MWVYFLFKEGNRESRGFQSGSSESLPSELSSKDRIGETRM